MQGWKTDKKSRSLKVSWGEEVDVNDRALRFLVIDKTRLTTLSDSQRVFVFSEKCSGSFSVSQISGEEKQLTT